MSNTLSLLPNPPRSLGERLEQARHRVFVGRERELHLWQEALQAAVWPIALWHVHGVGGIGKTSLLREWALLARQQGIAVVTVDARDFVATPEAFCDAVLEGVLELGENSVVPGEEATVGSVRDALETLGLRLVLQVDSYEKIESLDSWFREVFLPVLPISVAVVTAGRTDLPWPWRADSGWQELMSSLELDFFNREESSRFLNRLGVHVEAQIALLGWAHGHPLALALATDLWLKTPHHDTFEDDILEAELGGAFSHHSGSAPFRPQEAPRLVGALLSAFLNNENRLSHEQRTALEACAIVAVMTEELLGVMLGDEESPLSAEKTQEVFEWLRSLSIIQANRFGLFPHDVVRDALIADLRWRHPSWHAELHRRARQFYATRVNTVTESEQQRLVFDGIYLHRQSPSVAPYLHWRENLCHLERARPEEVPVLLDWVQQYEGAESRALAQRWFEAQPEGLIVARDNLGKAQGFIFQLALSRASSRDIEADPATRAIWKFLRETAPLREGERATLFRFWMSEEGYQDVNATQSLLFVQAVRHYLTTPNLAYTLFPCATPDFWSDGLLYADLKRLPEADFCVGDHDFGIFGHDWRARPVVAWLELLSQREIQSVSMAPPLLTSAPEATFGVLSKEAFFEATREALRLMGRPGALLDSPLLKTSLVDRRARLLPHEVSHSKATPALENRVEALRLLLRETMQQLQSTPRHDKEYTALDLVYGRRALSQEAAASAMDVSHSSLRRYVRSGTNFIAETLWAGERGIFPTHAASNNEN